MATVRAYATSGAGVKRSYPNTTFDVPALITEDFDYVLQRFEIPDVVQHKRITGISVNAYGTRWLDYDSLGVFFLIPQNDWYENLVTFNTLPEWRTSWLHLYTSSTTSPSWGENDLTNDGHTKNLIEYGIALMPFSDGATAFTSASAENAPYLLLTYQDPTIFLESASPKSGYVPKNLNTTLSWNISGDGYVYKGVEQTSAVIEWRSGETGTAHSINVGTSQQYTIPGGTFSSETIQWRVTVYSSGQTVASPWYTLSTVEPTSTAEPLAPIGGFVDSTKPITFSWNHIIETGTDQTAFDLQYSTDGSQFATVASETTANEYTVVPAGTFAPGPLYWRVRTYNTDGAAGAWSTVMQTTAIGAPEAPVVTLDDTSPRPSVRWQASGQQAYEVRIDGETVAKAFGVTKTYRASTYLADGQHSISVRVQSQYGLWSEWGTVSVQITNMAGSAITLTATGGNQAALTWTTEGAYDKYYVYRDGELIAKTTATSYDDALTNDAHIYQVRGAYGSSGDYGLSNAVNVVVRPETVTIATVDGATSISLPYSETNKRTTTTNTQRQMTAMYFAGSPLPSMEIAEWTDRSMTITAALKPDESKAALMSLVGKIVCARDQFGNCVIGPLPGWMTRDYEMYTTIQTTIQDVNWREAIKHDPIT